MSYLVQMLLPTTQSHGQPLKGDAFGVTRRELVEKFGGLTAYLQAPAKGLWKTEGDEVDRDDVVIFEVMADTLDRPWWATYRETLRRRFEQKELVVRALPIEPL